MVSTLWYWTQVRIAASGRHMIREVQQLRIRTFFGQRFPELANQPKLETTEDKFIQGQLLRLLKDKALEPDTRLAAEGCLRCYISHQILLSCSDLESSFGNEHGFTKEEMLGIVLDDVDLSRSFFVEPRPNDYQPFAAQILRKFDPEHKQGEETTSLSTWASKLTKRHGDLNKFLLEHGVLLRSDWSILNEKEPETLQRILSNVYGLPQNEIECACILLRSYHRVYRSQRLKNRRRGLCSDPTQEQLNGIKQEMEKAGILSFSPEQIMEQLLKLADYLRQYYLANKSGMPPSESLDDPERGQPIESPPIEFENEQAVFLERYHQELLVCLDRAIEQEINQRRTYLQHKDPDKAEKYIPALTYYCCEEKTMEEIAVAVGLKAQYQVTRLLKIDDFIANIRQHTFNQLKGRVMELAEECFHLDQSPRPDKQEIEAALMADLEQKIVKPRANAADRSSDNLFTQRLCCIIRRFQ